MFSKCIPSIGEADWQATNRSVHKVFSILAQLRATDTWAMSVCAFMVFVLD